MDGDDMERGGGHAGGGEQPQGGVGHTATDGLVSSGHEAPAPPGRPSGVADVHAAAFLQTQKRSSDFVQAHTEAKVAAEATKGTQGLWTGVVFPCMSNILGVILFLRAPWIVGKAGILNAFGLVFVCCSCTFVTTLSLSAVATNGKIKGGGSYYIISRSMGPALGAGVGLCFYMANSIGAAMYFIGTIEAWEIAQPDLQIVGVGDINNIRVMALIVLAGALCIVGGGLKYVVRLGTFFLMIVLAVIGCMYLGCFIGPDMPGTQPREYDVEVTDEEGNVSVIQLVWGGVAKAVEHWKDNWDSAWDMDQLSYPLDKTKYSFITMMGLWFPANTGIMAGSNRSADLKDPSAYIPKGTLTAQLTTSSIYLSFIILYGLVAPRRTLLDDRFFAATAAWPLKGVVVYGVMASTIAAGLTSLVSGTRLLSAIAGDKTLPILSVFAAKPGREPRLALLASGVLCACAILIGELNAVAPILTMFFLMCYTCVNASCTISEAVQDPNWRPQFRYFHWSVSLFGTLLCIWMMFAMDALKATIAILFCSLVMAYSSYNSHAVKWGDGFQGMKFQLARNILMKMDLKTHIKNWRPQLLVIQEATFELKKTFEAGHDLLVENPDFLRVVSQLKGGRGITILGLICKNLAYKVDAASAEQSRRQIIDGNDSIKAMLRKYQIEGFGRCMYTKYFVEGLSSLIQVVGLGAFQPNCVMTSWPEDWRDASSEVCLQKRANFLRMVGTASLYEKAMIVSKGNSWPDFEERRVGTIDIWWVVGDGGILLLLPFLLKKHKVWQQCRTRLFVLAAGEGADAKKFDDELKLYVKDFRLEVEAQVVVLDAKFVEESTGVDIDAKVVEAQVPPAAADAPPQTSGAAPTNGPVQATGAAQADGAAKENGEAKASGAAQDAGAEQEPGSAQADGAAQAAGTVQPKADANQQGEGGEDEIDLDAVTVDVDEMLAGRVDIGELTTAMAKKDEPTRAISVNTQGGTFGGSLLRQISEMTDGNMKSKPFSGLSGMSNQHQFFLSNEAQLKSTAPCSPNERDIAEMLGSLMDKHSGKADLVVTNLPDLPAAESAFGYFELVEAMTSKLTRCILVRSTAHQVITEFT